MSTGMGVAVIGGGKPNNDRMAQCLATRSAKMYPVVTVDDVSRLFDDKNKRVCAVISYCSDDADVKKHTIGVLEEVKRQHPLPPVILFPERTLCGEMFPLEYMRFCDVLMPGPDPLSPDCLPYWYIAFEKAKKSLIDADGRVLIDLWGSATNRKGVAPYSHVSVPRSIPFQVLANHACHCSDVSMLRGADLTPLLDVVEISAPPYQCKLLCVSAEIDAHWVIELYGIPYLRAVAETKAAAVDVLAEIIVTYYRVACSPEYFVRLSSGLQRIHSDVKALIESGGKNERADNAIN